MSRPRAATVRWVSQALFLAAYLALFGLTVQRFSGAAPVSEFLKLDLLVAVVAQVASRTLIPELVVFGAAIVVLTLVAGRAFCGWICPLGSLIDLSDWLWFRRRRPKPRDLRPLKYYLLVGVLVSALVGASATFLLDPIVLLTRSLTIAVFPAAQLGLRSASETLQAPFLYQPLEWKGLVPETQVYFAMNWLVLAIFAAVFALSAWGRRFWCRNLCPLGALLGLLSRARLLNKRVMEACNQCGRCALECRGQAITRDGQITNPSECVDCYHCVAICPTRALDVRLARAAPGALASARDDSTSGREGRLDLSRRRLMQAAALGLGWAAVVKTSPGAKQAVTGVQTASDALLRPPGALPEAAFLDRCIRCGACLKVCPTNALHPALQEAGFEGFWSPILVPRIGGCVEGCVACPQVCPTGAIQPFTAEEKKALFIGTARIDRSACIVWNADKACLVCDEQCSYRAIRWEEVEGVRRPFVIEEKCVGCGLCEYHCPVQPVAAIRVYSQGDKRDWSRAHQREYQESAARAIKAAEKKLPNVEKKSN